MARPAGEVLLCLRRDFDAAMVHFGMSTEARAVAWLAARDSIRSSAPCYRAIAQSLSTPDGPVKPKRGRVV